MEARRVARLGGLPSPVAYGDVALTALLTHDLGQARAFAERELGPLADPEAARLAESVLEVLVHQGSPRRAAQRLGLHENTVAKRARAAEDLLGRAIDARPVETLAALLVLRAVRRDVHG
jgi:DNA-binding PucR family transcriptional regulator